MGAQEWVCNLAMGEAQSTDGLCGCGEGNDCGMEQMDVLAEVCPVVAYLSSVQGASQELLMASRNDDTLGMMKAITDGAHLEARWPQLMVQQRSAKADADHEVGLTPLMYAAHNGSVEAVILLLTARAQVNAVDETFLTPLHFAAAAGSLDVCNLLVANGAKTYNVDVLDKTPLDCVPEEFRTKSDAQKWSHCLAKNRNSGRATLRSTRELTSGSDFAFQKATKDSREGF